MATTHRYTNKSGVRWEVRYRTPDHRPTRKRGFVTKRDAERFANSVEVSKHTGAYVDPSAGKVTVGDLGPKWLSNQSGHMKPSGYRSYDSAWRIHVEPHWGKTPVSNIKPTAVKAWVTELATAPKTGRKTGVADPETGRTTGKGLSASTIETCLRVLAGVLGDAVSDRRIVSNPARGVKLPRRKDKPHKYLSHAQVAALADQAPKHRAIVLLLSYCGLRWGELAALRVRDVDFLRRRIALTENAPMVGMKVVVGSLKGNTNRPVPIPKFVADELAKVCRGKGRDDLLWTNRKGEHLGPPASKDSWLSGAVARCMKADETFPRVTAHDLRHTAASLAVSAGANVKAVQKMLGHKSAAMTLDVYADLFDDDLDAVAERLEESASKVRPNAGLKAVASA
ncbi:tyrosine-type recombinase/integrase [Nocardia cyriacigeorgica]|uniref:tyrosine-type recombinase/integrase n=1 Tax=Nocardia cyriacigeorgica TaxID=135487 RepID=UPI00031688C2|nr:site-specific integrase [Nocardia cyriacigeorgica]TLF58470.1 site-specific integrase [Nocardia cyriacigeorgica]